MKVRKLAGKLDDNFQDFYYVYEHWLDGQLFYVGKGKKDRAFLVGRNRLWGEFTKDKIDEIEVIIKGYFQKERDAFDFEEHLINKYSSKGIPLTNISKNSCFMYNLEDFNLTDSIINTNLENENPTDEEIVSFEHLNNKEKLNLIIELTEEVVIKDHSIEHGVYGESPAHRTLEINKKIEKDKIKRDLVYQELKIEIRNKNSNYLEIEEKIDFIISIKEATMYRRVECTTWESLRSDQEEQLKTFDEIKEEIEFNEMKVNEVEKFL